MPPAAAALTSAPVYTYDPGCADSGPCGGHFVAGIGFYYLQPYWERNPAYVATLNQLAGGFGGGLAGIDLVATTLDDQQDFNYDAEIAPRVLLGYVSGDGLGVRARYWHFEQGDAIGVVNNVPPIEPAIMVPGFTVQSAAPLGLGFESPSLAVLFGFPDVMVFEGDLELDVWDFEVTKDLQIGNWTLLASGGIRYAHLAQSYNAFLSSRAIFDSTFDVGGVDFPSVVDLSTQAAVLSGHHFQGAGPTAALEARYPIIEGGLALYGSARGAVLFGTAEQRATERGALTGTITVDLPGPDAVVPVSFVSVDAKSAPRDDILPVAEFEVGFEWAMESGGSQLFIQVAVVSQTWFGAGNASNNKVISRDTLILVPEESTDDRVDLGFFGLSVMAGISR